MAFGSVAETANLVARLTLKDEFSRPIQGIKGKLAGLGPTASRAGKAIGVGLAAGLTTGGLLVGRAISGGLHSLDELENATTSVDAAIKQMGLTGQVTSGQIHDWANQIEKDVGAAFDDKAITQAATTLIRYGKISEANLRPALVVMTDLAAKTGSVDSAATLLAKALADPAKAAGKLARQGVILTKAEQDQIKALTEAGDAAGAQKVLLDALTKSTQGAAAASQGPYARSLATLRDVTEDAERALAEGFLPVIEKVRDILSRELAKPQTIENIRKFGQGLATGLDKLVDIATGLPWNQIGDAFKLVGQGSKAALDLFTGLPPWVQTAVLTGWGLNKLTGGGLGTIVGELGKGLIKGVLGMNAGVVNIRAAVVNGGGLPGGVAGGAAATGGMGLLAAGASLVTVAAIEVAAADVLGKALRTAVTGSDAPLAKDYTVAQLGPLQVGLFRSQVQAIREATGITQRATKAQTDQDLANFRQGERSDMTHTAQLKYATDRSRDAIESARIAIASGVRNTSAKVGDLQRTEANSTSRIVGAIQRNRPIVNVRVNVAKGDTIRVTKNYQSGQNLHTGGQQEFG